MMTLISNHVKELIAIIVPVGIWLLNRFYEAPAKLIQGTRHQFTFLIDEPTFDANGVIIATAKNVHTAGISFVNEGRSPATNVEITFNWKLQHINIWPQRSYQSDLSPDNRWTLKLSSLAPKEFLSVELLAVGNPPLPAITSARCDECIASMVQLHPTRVLSKSTRWLLMWLLATGAAASVYVFISLMQLAIR